jgi:hypothetical protein
MLGDFTGKKCYQITFWHDHYLELKILSLHQHFKDLVVDGGCSKNILVYMEIKMLINNLQILTIKQP